MKNIRNFQLSLVSSVSFQENYERVNRVFLFMIENNLYSESFRSLLVKLEKMSDEGIMESSISERQVMVHLNFRKNYFASVQLYPKHPMKNWDTQENIQFIEEFQEKLFKAVDEGVVDICHVSNKSYGRLYALYFIRVTNDYPIQTQDEVKMREIEIEVERFFEGVCKKINSKKLIEELSPTIFNIGSKVVKTGDEVCRKLHLPSRNDYRFRR